MMLNKKHFFFFLFIPFEIIIFFLLLSSSPQSRLDISKTMKYPGKSSEHNSKNENQMLTIKIMESLKLTLPNGTNQLRIWIPLPPTDDYQKVDSFRIESSLNYSVLKDPDFGNQTLFVDMNSSTKESLHFAAGQAQSEDGSFEIKWEYKIERKEQNGLSVNARSSNKEVLTELFLEERGLVIIDDRIRNIVEKVTYNISDPLKKARALYDYVLTHIDYDTSVPGWGNGDVVYACNVGKGNCTDFHSLFISLSRAAGIPARFQIGYPVPVEEKTGKLLKPYHCWAEFFIEDTGWIPVDISEAWKNPDKADYYFGNLDKDRILISTGREICLSAKQSGGPVVNYFVNPYIEAD